MTIYTIYPICPISTISGLRGISRDEPRLNQVVDGEIGEIGEIVKIEFLYWEECASHDLALQRLREVLTEWQIAAPVHLVQITTEQQAAALGFPGSPTIRIDGQDLFPAPDGPYGLTCRVYRTDDGRPTPLPTIEMIRRAMRTVLRKTQGGIIVHGDHA